MAKKQYHHGNLRDSLVASAHGILAAEGVPGLSLRKVAAHAGVSATALYSHFKDKRELLAVLAAQGFEQLTGLMASEAGKRAIRDGAAAPDLAGLALGYVRFATGNKALFQLMFGRETGNPKDYPYLQEASARCYGLMADAVAARLEQSGSADSPAVAATAAWSLVHGLSTLINDGRISAGTCELASNEALVLQACRMLTFAEAAQEPG
ncbi:MAG: TetR/AcrR family transcriptional regulator [Halioglobus sp.]|nr:TetR/AcrR family transcriptional regulator [Halioglobus sp.]